MLLLCHWDLLETLEVFYFDSRLLVAEKNQSERFGCCLINNLNPKSTLINHLLIWIFILLIAKKFVNKYF